MSQNFLSTLDSIRMVLAPSLQNEFGSDSMIFVLKKNTKLQSMDFPVCQNAPMDFRNPDGPQLNSLSCSDDKYYTREWNVLENKTLIFTNL